MDTSYEHVFLLLTHVPKKQIRHAKAVVRPAGIQQHLVIKDHAPLPVSPGPLTSNKANQTQIELKWEQSCRGRHLTSNTRADGDAQCPQSKREK